MTPVPPVKPRGQHQVAPAGGGGRQSYIPFDLAVPGGDHLLQARRHRPLGSIGPGLPLTDVEGEVAAAPLDVA